MKLHTIKGIALSLLLAGSLSASAAINEQLVDPQATEETQELYRFLLDNYGKRVITGAVASGVKDTKMADHIKNQTGHYPVINCFDFMEHYQNAPVNPGGWSHANYSNPNVEEAWVKAGGIVSYQWHWFVPIDEANKNSFSNVEFYCNGAGNRDTYFSAENAMKEGTWERQIIDRDIDAVAGYLLEMQNRKIPVLWRPLHEACGNNGKYNGGKAWFWWGNSGADAFKRLWRYMFNRLEAKGVHNLIWVWTSCIDDADWYPGNEYVDIVSTDNYSLKDGNHGSLIREYNYLKGLYPDKMLALSECGGMPSIANMQAQGDMWSWVAPWNGDYTTGNHNSSDFYRTEYANERIMHRDNKDNDGPIDPDPVDPTPGEGKVLYSSSNPQMLNWNVLLSVDASTASTFRAGDEILVTFTEMGNVNDWPKIGFEKGSWKSYPEEYQVFQYQNWGITLPHTASYKLTSEDVSNMKNGFDMKGVAVKVSQIVYKSNSVSTAAALTGENDTKTVDVFNMQGMVVRQGVQLGEALRGLPAGIYICNGKKHIVR